MGAPVSSPQALNMLIIQQTGCLRVLCRILLALGSHLRSMLTTASHNHNTQRMPIIACRITAATLWAQLNTPHGMPPSCMQHGTPLLIHAARNGHLAVVQELCTADANTDATDEVSTDCGEMDTGGTLTSLAS